MGHLILHWFGIDTQQSPFYDFWSGIGPVLFAMLPFMVMAIVNWRHKNCHVHWCWRIGRFQAGQWTVCNKHHPDSLPTAEEAAIAHAEALRG